jgi:hypothetical protein
MQVASAFISESTAQAAGMAAATGYCFSIVTSMGTFREHKQKGLVHLRAPAPGEWAQKRSGVHA